MTGPQSRGPVISGGPELEAVGRYVLARVLTFTQISASAFADKTDRSRPISFARGLAAYLMHVELELDQVTCARVLPITRQAIGQAAEKIEELREDPAMDAAIEILAADVRRRFAGRAAANDN